MARKQEIIATLRDGKVYLTGRTFPFRECLKEAGARFDSNQSAWIISHDSAPSLIAELRQLGATVTGNLTSQDTNTNSTPTPSQPKTNNDFAWQISSALLQLAAAIQDLAAAIDKLKKED